MPDLAQFAAWISDEWNNKEQVWQQKIDAADPKVLRKETPVEHTHQLIQPVHAPQLGAHVFCLQQSLGDDPQQLRRHRLLRPTRDEAAGSLRQEVFELPADAGFVQFVARDTAGTRLQGNSTDTAARHRKVRYDEGWVWFKLAGPGTAVVSVGRDAQGAAAELRVLSGRGPGFSVHPHDRRGRYGRVGVEYRFWWVGANCSNQAPGASSSSAPSHGPAAALKADTHASPLGKALPGRGVHT